MKPNHRSLAAAFAVLGLAALVAPNASAECGALSRMPGLRSPSLRGYLRPAAFSDGDERGRRDDRNPIVGLWHVKFVVPGVSAPVDAGYAQWHSDGTEIMNSGSRPPSTSSFCLGVWEQTGERQYKLNHFGISWSGDTSANAPIGPANIREEVTLDRSGETFTGSFTIDQYDEDLNVLAHVAGAITGTRITVDTPPSSIF
jgi:hypothetical protein